MQASRRRQWRARILLLLTAVGLLSLIGPTAGRRLKHQNASGSSSSGNINNHHRHRHHARRAVYFAALEAAQTNASQLAAEPQARCCACDEAKYELVFEGLWSRYTHPEDFPDNYWLAYFGDLIGASHSGDFSMWSLDSPASQGVRELAETGATKRLEAELKSVSAKTRTIIKARELRYPTLSSKTSAVFRTDKVHHLVSVLSKLGPSPDWMLGVSNLDLCQPDCSWASQRVVNLQLLDAGTDSGATFAAAKQATKPAERVHYFRKLQPMQEPRDLSGQQQQQFGSPTQAPLYEQIGSPNLLVVVDGNERQKFYDDNNNDSGRQSRGPQQVGGEHLKPFARLTITRQRIYEKPCESLTPTAGGTDGPSGAGQLGQDSWGSLSGVGSQERDFSIDQSQKDRQPTTIDCRFTGWSDWSTCSSQCGKGIRTRTRAFVAPDELTSQSAAGCQQADLIEKQICLAECRPAGHSGSCVTRDWSEWSKCSMSCGRGFRRRTRTPISGDACQAIELAQMEQCTGSCGDDLAPEEASGSGAPAEQRCELTAWSQWSECPVACGRGTTIRVRQFVRREEAQQCAHVKLIEKKPCQGRFQSCSGLAEKGEWHRWPWPAVR